MDLHWLEQHTLPCPFRSLTGFDCPGCGFQRSVLLLLRGDLFHSLVMWPALLPVCITLLFMMLHVRYKFKGGLKILMGMYFTTAGIITISYIVKQIILLS